VYASKVWRTCHISNTFRQAAVSNKARLIHLLAFPDVQLLDVSGPLQVFATANDLARERGLSRPYDAFVIAASVADAPNRVMSSAGLGLETHPLPPAQKISDTFIVAGGRGVHAAAGDPELIRWCQHHAARSRRVASVCTGAFLLAASGLLNNRRVVTHWSHCDELARCYPALHVESDPIYIRDESIWTSAGVTAGIDLALAFVEDDLGRDLALDVARQLVVFLKRPGGQAQFSKTLSMQNTDDAFGALHAWIVDNLTADLSVTAMAERTGMSERSFLRRYREKTGKTPARAVELVRSESAMRLLADTKLPIKRIAQHCGFGTEETLRRSLLRTFAVTPQAYRERFG